MQSGEKESCPSQATREEEVTTPDRAPPAPTLLLLLLAGNLSERGGVVLEPPFTSQQHPHPTATHRHATHITLKAAGGGSRERKPQGLGCTRSELEENNPEQPAPPAPLRANCRL